MIIAIGLLFTPFAILVFMAWKVGRESVVVRPTNTRLVPVEECSVCGEPGCPDHM